MKTTNYFLMLLLLSTSPISFADIEDEDNARELIKSGVVGSTTNQDDFDKLKHSLDPIYRTVEEVDSYVLSNPLAPGDVFSWRDSQLKRYKFQYEDENTRLRFNMEADYFILEGQGDWYSSYSIYGIDSYPDSKRYQTVEGEEPHFFTNAEQEYMFIPTQDKKLSSNMEFNPLEHMSLDESSIEDAREYVEGMIEKRESEFADESINSAVADVLSEDLKEQVQQVTNDPNSLNLDFIYNSPVNEVGLLVAKLAEKNLSKTCYYEYQNLTDTIESRDVLKAYLSELQDMIQSSIEKNYPKLYGTYIKKKKGDAQEFVEFNEHRNTEKDKDHKYLSKSLSSEMYIDELDTKSKELTVTFTPVSIKISQVKDHSYSNDSYDFGLLYDTFSETSLVNLENKEMALAVLPVLKIQIDKDGKVLNPDAIKQQIAKELARKSGKVDAFTDMCKDEMRDFFALRKKLELQKNATTMVKASLAHFDQIDAQKAFDAREGLLKEAYGHKETFEQTVESGGLVMKE